jgi:hypothetical protein
MNLEPVPDLEEEVIDYFARCIPRLEEYGRVFNQFE